jgi:hypothetical protein
VFWIRAVECRKYQIRCSVDSLTLFPENRSNTLNIIASNSLISTADIAIYTPFYSTKTS